MDQMIALGVLCLVSVLSNYWFSRRRQDNITYTPVGRVDQPNSELNINPEDVRRAEGKPGFTELRDLALQWGWGPGDAAGLAAEALKCQSSGSYVNDLRFALARLKP